MPTVGITKLSVWSLLGGGRLGKRMSHTVVDLEDGGLRGAYFAHHSDSESGYLRMHLALRKRFFTLKALQLLKLRHDCTSITAFTGRELEEAGLQPRPLT